jgi:hypothetical protein
MLLLGDGSGRFFRRFSLGNSRKVLSRKWNGYVLLLQYITAPAVAGDSSPAITDGHHGLYRTRGSVCASPFDILGSPALKASRSGQYWTNLNLGVYRMRASTSSPGSQVMACPVPLAGSCTLSYLCTRMTGHRSADIVARMIASKITSQEWELPPWLPLHYLTDLPKRFESSHTPQ